MGYGAREIERHCREVSVVVVVVGEQGQAHGRAEDETRHVGLALTPHAAHKVCLGDVALLE